MLDKAEKRRLRQEGRDACSERTEEFGCVFPCESKCFTESIRRVAAIRDKHFRLLDTEDTAQLSEKEVQYAGKLLLN